MEDSLFQRFRGWMRSGGGTVVTILVCVGILGFAIHSVFFRSAHADKVRAILAQGRDYTYICTSCGQTGKLHLPYDAKFPQECPGCHKKSAEIGFHCVKCTKIIQPLRQETYYCPHCNFFYDNRLSLPEMDGPLPKVTSQPAKGAPIEPAAPPRALK